MKMLKFEEETNMDNFVFAGIYSPKYEKFYKPLREELLEIIPKENTQYRMISQEIFNKKVPGRKCNWCGDRFETCSFVFHWGEDCKIQHQFELYEKYKDTNKIIVYTDCDVALKSNTVVTLQKYEKMLDEYDILFQKEPSRKRGRWKSEINIGLTVSYSSEKILRFYKKVLDFMHTHDHPHNWDQQVVNNLLYHSPELLDFGLIPNHNLLDHRLLGGRG